MDFEVSVADLSSAQAAEKAAGCLEESGLCHLRRALPTNVLERFLRHFEPCFSELDARMDEIELDRHRVFK